MIVNGVRDRYAKNHMSVLAKSVVFDDTGLRPVLGVVLCITWQLNFRLSYGSLNGSKVVEEQVAIGSSQVNWISKTEKLTDT